MNYLSQIQSTAFSFINVIRDHCYTNWVICLSLACRLQITIQLIWFGLLSTKNSTQSTDNNNLRARPSFHIISITTLLILFLLRPFFHLTQLFFRSQLIFFWLSFAMFWFCHLRDEFTHQFSPKDSRVPHTWRSEGWSRCQTWRQKARFPCTILKDKDREHFTFATTTQWLTSPAFSFNRSFQAVRQAFAHEVFAVGGSRLVEFLNL